MNTIQNRSGLYTQIHLILFGICRRDCCRYFRLRFLLCFLHKARSQFRQCPPDQQKKTHTTKKGVALARLASKSQSISCRCGFDGKRGVRKMFSLDMFLLWRVSISLCIPVYTYPAFVANTCCVFIVFCAISLINCCNIS